MMKYLKLFESFNSDLWTQMSAREFDEKLLTHISMTKLDMSTLSSYFASFKLDRLKQDENFRNSFVIYDNYGRLDNITIYKLEDEWYIFSFGYGDYSVNFLCDQLDSVQELLKLSTKDDKIEVPFDYFELTSHRSYPRNRIQSPKSTQFADLIREKIKEYGFNIEYDEILPKTSGSNGIKFWKAVDYLSTEAMDFFNTRREEGRRIVMVTIGFSSYQDDYFTIRFGNGPELRRKNITFECKGLDGLVKLLDDKFSLLK